MDSNIQRAVEGKTDGRHLIVRQADRHVSLRIEDIVEIIRMVAISPLPEQSPVFAGVINYRGEIIPIVNLWTMLGQETPSISTEMAIIIFQEGENKLGLIAEQVIGVNRLTVTSRPDDLDPGLIPLVEGVSHLPGIRGLILVLNPERIRIHRREYIAEQAATS